MNGPFLQDGPALHIQTLSHVSRELTEVILRWSRKILAATALPEHCLLMSATFIRNNPQQSRAEIPFVITLRKLSLHLKLRASRHIPGRCPDINGVFRTKTG